MPHRTSLAARLRADEPILTLWSSLAVPIVAELFARGGYKAVTLDMQHGQHDLGDVREGIAQLALTEAHAIVRIPVGENATASRLLDLGAEAVIAPMINSAEDARAFAEAMKYPPVGERSWGPHRGATILGQDPNDYLKCANDETVSLAMIETPEAVAALDEILAVPGIDGVFVGPSDLSLTLSKGAGLDPTGDHIASIAAEVARKTRAAGKIAGIFCMGSEMVHRSRAAGFQLMAHGIDFKLIMDAGAAMAAELN